MSPARGGVVVTVALVHTSALLACGGQTTHLAMLVNRVHDPVDARITADGLVLRVDENDLVVLVRAVLVDPVAVEDAQVGAAASDTLLSGGLERTLVLELVDTLVGRLAYNNTSASVLCTWMFPFKFFLMSLTVGGTLGRRPLPSTPSDANTVDNVALLGLVPQASGLVRARWAGSAVDDVQLAELN